ncbi:50S ribosomal protein L17 [Candidatus Hepatincola sp. Pdp]
MRHRLSGRKLGRTTAERKALFKNMAIALIINEQIKSTLPKAKELRSYVDKLITLSKKGTLAHKRKAFALLRNDEAVHKLFSALGSRYQERNGGYTRVLKSGFRTGDNAPMAIIEFIDRDVNAKGSKDLKQTVEAE